MPSFIAFIITLALFRFAPHPENLAPFGAFALMGGLYLGKRHAIAVPLLALLATDFFLNKQMGSPLFAWARGIDYAAFLLIGLAGLGLRQSGRAPKLAAAFATPFFFFLVSNFGVWLFGVGISGAPYEKSLAGLLACYAAGLPFLSGTVLGDWGYMALFAGVLMLARIPFRSPARERAI